MRASIYQAKCVAPGFLPFISIAGESRNREWVTGGGGVSARSISHTWQFPHLSLTIPTCAVLHTPMYHSFLGWWIASARGRNDISPILFRLKPPTISLLFLFSRAVSLSSTLPHPASSIFRFKEWMGVQLWHFVESFPVTARRRRCAECGKKD